MRVSEHDRTESVGGSVSEPGGTVLAVRAERQRRVRMKSAMACSVPAVPALSSGLAFR